MLDLASTHATSRASKDPATRVTGAQVAIAAIVFVAIILRLGIVSIGPILPAIREHFRLSHALAALMTTIPDFLMVCSRCRRRGSRTALDATAK